MGKIDAISFLLEHEDFQESAVHSALVDSLVKRTEITETANRRKISRENRIAAVSPDASETKSRRPRGRPRKNTASTGDTAQEDTHAKHVNAGKQSHKNDIAVDDNKTSLAMAADITPNIKRTVATKKENTTIASTENIVEERIVDPNSGPRVTKERTVSEHTVHTAEIIDTTDVSYKTRELAYETELGVG